MARALWDLAVRHETSPIGEVEERYTALFDLNPVCTLHIGYQVFGDTYPRGDLIANLGGELRKAGVSRGELPDFLRPSFGSWVGWTTQRTPRPLATVVLQALDRMMAALEDSEPLERPPPRAPGALPEDRAASEVPLYPAATQPASNHGDAMLNALLFGALPYVAIVLFLVVSIQRYRRDPFTFSSLSSQFLETRRLFWGSVPFHVGILDVFLGHLTGFLLPRGLVPVEPRAGPPPCLRGDRAHVRAPHPHWPGRPPRRPSSEPASARQHEPGRPARLRPLAVPSRDGPLGRDGPALGQRLVHTGGRPVPALDLPGSSLTSNAWPT